MEKYQPDIMDVCKDSMRLYEDTIKEAALELDSTKEFILLRKAERILANAQVEYRLKTQPEPFRPLNIPKKFNALF